MGQEWFPPHRAIVLVEAVCVDRSVSWGSKKSKAMFASADAPSVLSCWGGSVELECSLVLAFAQSAAHVLHNPRAPRAAWGVVETPLRGSAGREGEARWWLRAPH